MIRYGDTAGATSHVCAGSCAPGHWCPAGSISATQNACPAGRYSAGQAGDNLCHGDCDAGFVCAEGATKPFTTSETDDGTGVTMCGAESVYCPKGTKTAILAEPGYYTVGGTPKTRSAQELCPLGSYCIAGRKTICPPGSFGETKGLSESACSGLCVSGRYGMAGEHTTAWCEGYCDPGYWCTAGSAVPNPEACPAGRFSTGFAKTNECTGPCSPGYFCPVASESSEQQPCGDVALYCPEGSGSPKTVSRGFYSTPVDADEDKRTGQAECDVGCVMWWPSHFCPAVPALRCSRASPSLPCRQAHMLVRHPFRLSGWHVRCNDWPKRSHLQWQVLGWLLRQRRRADGANVRGRVRGRVHVPGW